MAKILINTTWGSDDPTRATLAFVGAQGFLDAGHDVGIALLGEAAYLMKDYIVDQIDGVGWPPLKELFPKAIESGASIYV
jgi:predicted peroxiredoxin